MKLCPCGSQKRYLDCCGLYIEKKIPAPSPETLMRSRYTAFVEKKADYIKRTMREPALLKFRKKDFKNMKKDNTQWLGLEIVKSHQENETTGFVEFKAKFKHNDKEGCIHENSLFHLIDRRWYYVDGLFID